MVPDLDGEEDVPTCCIELPPTVWSPSYTPSPSLGRAGIMSWLKKDLPPIPTADDASNLRVLAVGTLYEIQTFFVDGFPLEGSKLRAQSVARERGGSVANILSLLSQFEGVTPCMCAPVGSRKESARVESDLDGLGINTEHSVRRDGEAVPTAYVIHSLSTGSKTIINHNPLPDITHAEFVKLMKPIFIADGSSSTSSGRSASIPARAQAPPRIPPFDWVHFEARTSPHMLTNLRWVDDISREQGYRNSVVISVGMDRPVHDMDELMQFADVVFFSKSLAVQAMQSSPKTFLLGHSLHCAPHAILLATPSSHLSGAALLSVPNREYYQSSELVKDEKAAIVTGNGLNGWAANEEEQDFVDLSGTGDAFIAGMIYSMTRRLLPGEPYTPSYDEYVPQPGDERGRWRLEECLRFATELAGRKNRRPTFEGLAQAMADVGWFTTQGPK